MTLDEYYSQSLPPGLLRQRELVSERSAPAPKPRRKPRVPVETAEVCDE